MKKISLLTCILLICQISYGIRRYVKPNGTNNTGTDQTTWAKASNDLQRVINNSNDGDEIWVANGTYRPNRLAHNTTTYFDSNNPPANTDARDRAFVLKKNVRIYGGFQVDATTMDQRDLKGSILSGDFGTAMQIDGAGQTLSMSGNDDNAYHVVIAVGNLGNAELNGFVIKGGYANGVNYIEVTQPSATSIYRVNRNAGGGIYYKSSFANISHIVLQYVTIIGNYASGMGGGSYLSTGDITFNHCEIELNASYNAAGIMAHEGTSLRVSNSKIGGNYSSNRGGGVVTNGNYFGNTYQNTAIPRRTETTIAYTTIVNNYAAKDGAGLWNNQNALLKLLNTKIIKNYAQHNGAGIKNIETSSLMMINCLIADNITGDGKYGGIFNKRGSIEAQNVTLVNNGPKGYNDISVSQWTNSIIGDERTADKNVDYIPGLATDLEGFDIIATENNNLKLYNSPDITMIQIFNDPFQSDYSLKKSSPAIDAGTNDSYGVSLTTDSDLAGNGRLYGTLIDLGAYEWYTTLPVKLVNFSVKRNKSQAQLDWLTENEVNNKEFIISHSIDGKTFLAIGTVPSGGVSNRYKYVHQNPSSGINYYKLEQLDNDGSISNLGIKTVQIKLDQDIVATPNPVIQMASVRIEIGTYQKAELLNIYGIKLENQVILPNQYQLKFDLSRYPSGSYLLKLNGSASSKIVKLLRK